MLLPSGSPPPLQQVGEKGSRGADAQGILVSFEQKQDTDVAVSTSHMTEMLHSKGEEMGEGQGGFLLIKSNRSMRSLP